MAIQRQSLTNCSHNISVWTRLISRFPSLEDLSHHGAGLVKAPQLLYWRPLFAYPAPDLCPNISCAVGYSRILLEICRRPPAGRNLDNLTPKLRMLGFPRSRVVVVALTAARNVRNRSCSRSAEFIDFPPSSLLLKYSGE